MKDKQQQIDRLTRLAETAKSGHGGVDKDGRIVDRRDNPDSVPIAENKLMGNPKPNEGNIQGKG